MLRLTPYVAINSAFVPSQNRLCCRQGFSLVELSIVLIILGLMTGGILAGKSLIQAAAVRSVMNSVNEYRVAYFTYKLKYHCVPGDCTNTSLFFPGMLDGDGDGLISCQYFVYMPHCLSTVNEHEYAIQSVQAAGLIQSGDDTSTYPKTRLRGCRINYFADDGNAELYGARQDNYIRVYAPINVDPWNEDCMTPDEAYRVDQKMDDGSSSTGKVYGRRINYTANYQECADLPYNSGKQSAGFYNVANTSVACSLFQTP
jgi:prepilin-type N-terminal cleavage/methylation domain-containing protein